MKLSDEVKGWFFPYNEWSNIDNRDKLIDKIEKLEKENDNLVITISNLYQDIANLRGDIIYLEEKLEELQPETIEQIQARGKFEMQELEKQLSNFKPPEPTYDYKLESKNETK